MGTDAVYIWAHPEAVPQPSLVLAHHAFVMALLSHPLRIPANAIFTANVACVEINTIILVGRRHFATWLGEDTPCRNAFRLVTDAVYWTTYFGIRFGIHPWMVHVAWYRVPEPICERLLIVSSTPLPSPFSTRLGAGRGADGAVARVSSAGGVVGRSSDLQHRAARQADARSLACGTVTG